MRTCQDKDSIPLGELIGVLYAHSSDFYRVIADALVRQCHCWIISSRSWMRAPSVDDTMKELRETRHTYTKGQDIVSTSKQISSNSKQSLCDKLR